MNAVIDYHQIKLITKEVEDGLLFLEHQLVTYHKVTLADVEQEENDLSSLERFHQISVLYIQMAYHFDKILKKMEMPEQLGVSIKNIKQTYSRESGLGKEKMEYCSPSVLYFHLIYLIRQARESLSVIEDSMKKKRSVERIQSDCVKLYCLT